MENQSDLNPERETLINTFCEITSSTNPEALFYLESHNFDLDSAVSTFFETNPAVPSADVPAPASAAAANAHSPADSQSYSPSQSESSSPPRSRSPSPRRRSKQPQSSGAYNLRSSKHGNASSAPGASGAGRRSAGIHTFADLNRRTAAGSGSDSDEPQEYYTGGEKSGMLVQDPSKMNDVDAIFNQARQTQPVGGPVENLPPSSSRSFTGTARRLTGETVPSAPQRPEVVTHNITFWSNGFTVDDGPLRRLDDPENAHFLESIRNSECPKELQPPDRRTAVHVNLTRREENCPAPAKRKTPFHGVGRTLGGTTNDDAPVEPTVATAPLTSAPAPAMGLIVDETQPSTSIQLRLADGTRMVSRFNIHHTIRDIRGFIDASRPSGPRTYQLQTVGFPPKQLTDLEQTIEQAGLANSVVIQRV
ncbi:plant UBX domain-containing protein 4-like [Ipomoea triloba]|uniref:plant UBX domain-containing protein 4-like n=1 Tax=Ipomoea triloba TaxID=35885 RepID=UPI00125CDD66|nr:plant UBX domain-containing protein 4-like [Ipomoea triloba]